jgi:hypothetical protein
VGHDVIQRIVAVGQASKKVECAIASKGDLLYLPAGFVCHEKILKGDDIVGYKFPILFDSTADHLATVAASFKPSRPAPGQPETPVPLLVFAAHACRDASKSPGTDGAHGSANSPAAADCSRLSGAVGVGAGLGLSATVPPASSTETAPATQGEIAAATAAEAAATAEKENKAANLVV